MAWEPTLTYSSQICVGSVEHCRFSPRRHQFDYPLVMPLLNLDQIASLSQLHPKVAVNRRSLRYSFFESDYLRDHILDGENLKQRAWRCLKSNLQLKSASLDYHGSILMLAHWRFLNCVFNPITVFYFINTAGDFEYMMAEVSNTPWNQRTLYAHQIKADEQGQHIQRTTAKHFHVSPFNPMDMQYHWRFSFQPDAVRLNLNLTQAGENRFRASFALKSEALTSENFCQAIKKQPMMSWHAVLGIYWQALKLFAKRIPFYSHPEQTVSNKE